MLERAFARYAGINFNETDYAMRAILQFFRYAYTECMNALERLKKIYLAAAQRQTRNVCTKVVSGNNQPLTGSRSTRYRTNKRIQKWQQK